MAFFFENKFISFLFLFCFYEGYTQSIANYINNPSFEVLTPSYTMTPDDAAKFWIPIDPSHNSSYSVRTKLLGTVPIGFGGYQQPKSGDNFIGSQFYCDASTCGSTETRWYPRNILKSVLKPNTVYCAKYHVVNTNNCVVGIDSYAMYFGDSNIDTIKYASIPLTYINPQIQVSGNIISDTLNWVPITGTFVANGSEKYMVLGNFKSNAATNTAIINPTFLPSLGTDILIDDVSLIEMDLPAFAGRDTIVFPGSNVFLGREPDVGIDEACIWYKLPDMVNPIDTVAGFWINPTATSTYVVKQQLWCNNTPKWDTVVVETSIYVGNSLFDYAQSDIKVFPIPAQDFIELRVSQAELFKEINSVALYDNLGQLLNEQKINFENKSVQISTSDLANGIYFIRLKSGNSNYVNKRFVVSR